MWHYRYLKTHFIYRSEVNVYVLRPCGLIPLTKTAAITQGCTLQLGSNTFTSSGAALVNFASIL